MFVTRHASRTIHRKITTSLTTSGDDPSPHPLLSSTHTDERAQRRQKFIQMSGERRQQMTGSDTTIDNQHPPGQYEIRVKGHVDALWAAWFDGLSLTPKCDGTTVIHGPVADQAALHGLLRRVRDLGVPLISVTQVNPDQPDTQTNVPR
jgi:hypothetical protein